MKTIIKIFLWLHIKKEHMFVIVFKLIILNDLMTRYEFELFLMVAQTENENSTYIVEVMWLEILWLRFTIHQQE